MSEPKQTDRQTDIMSHLFTLWSDRCYSLLSREDKNKSVSEKVGIVGAARSISTRFMHHRNKKVRPSERGKDG